MALARRVWVPLNVRSVAAPSRAVADENRKVRRRNLSDSAFVMGLSGLAKLLRMRSAREPFASGIVNATSMAIGPDGQLCEHRPEDAEQQEAERDEPQRRERGALAPLHARAQNPIADKRDRHGGDDDDSGHRRTGRRGETKITLAEHGGPVLEEELEQRFEHGRILSL